MVYIEDNTMTAPTVVISENDVMHDIFAISLYLFVSR
jgi:hypothetical protein